MHISTDIIADIDRMIFQADSHKLLDFRGRSFASDSLSRMREDDIIILQTFDGSLSMERIGHDSILRFVLSRPAGNTSLPAGRQAKPCNAGLFDIEWVRKDLTESEVQESWRIISALHPEGSATRPCSQVQCPRRVCFGTVLKH